MTQTIESTFKFRSGHVAKNRVAMAPLTNMQSPTTQLSEEEFAWLELRIRGGFSMISTCASHVVPNAQAWPGELGIFDDFHKPGLKRLAEAANLNKCLIFPQLFHGGFRSPSSLNGVAPVSASSFILDAPDFEKPRALEEAEIFNLMNSFAVAARRAVDSGLPGVELHGANGYLFTQFLSPQTNCRTDKWGGNLANRSRFLIETARMIRQEIAKDKVLGVRLSPENTKLIHSIDIDEMIDVALELVSVGVDYISLSLWDAFKCPDKYPASRQTIAEKFRKAIPSEVALVISGKISTVTQAVSALNNGADFVALGAASIANPSWPTEALDPSFIPIKLPLTPKELQARNVSKAFMSYLERWNYVKKPAGDL